MTQLHCPTRPNSPLRSITLGCFLVLAALPHDLARAAPSSHRITLSSTAILDTPFALTEFPSPISAEFLVDDSILQPGFTGLIDELPNFSLLAPIVIGDATFTNDSIHVTPGGRVVDGELVEVFLHAAYLDPLEGQRELTTYFFPAFEWDGTDFNPSPPSEFIRGSYAIGRVPEPGSAGLLAMAGAMSVGPGTRRRR